MPDDAAHSFSQLDQAAASSAQQKPSNDPVQPCPLSKKVRVRIVAKDDDFAVIKDARYRLETEWDSFDGNTGSSGIVDHQIAALNKRGRLSVWPKDKDEPIVFDFVIEAIDPIDLETGVKARLKNLGFSEAGLEGFQSEFDFEPSEQLTPEAKQRLQDEFSEREQATEKQDWLPRDLGERLDKLYKKPQSG